MSGRKLPENETQHLAKWQVDQLITGLRRAGWDFVAVSLWRRTSPGPDGLGAGAGASGWECSTEMIPALPRLADNLRVLARELDELQAHSGMPEIIDAYTQVIEGVATRVAKTKEGHNGNDRPEDT